jgi:SAM-dependent methyltransferase
MALQTSPAAQESAEVYKSPEYYDIAFSMRDIEAECNFLCKLAPDAKHMLEIGSGNSPHMAPLLARGVRYTGLELSQEMIDYAHARLAPGTSATLVQGDMRVFDVPEPCDFAFLMVCSLFVGDNAELDSHFDSVARSLVLGGLYLLDDCVHFRLPDAELKWTMSRRGVRVHAHLRWVFDWVRQAFSERLVLDVDDRGRLVHCEDVSRRRALFPQEFLNYIAARPDFEFVGWWNGFDLDEPITPDRPVHRSVVVVRRV